MANITLPNNIQNTDTSDADKLMANLNAIITEYNATVGGLSGSIVTAPLGSALQVLRRNSANTANEYATLAVNRAFSWYLDGTSIVADEVGAKYIAPQNMTVTKIWFKLTSGTATIRIQNGTTDIQNSLSVTSSVGNTTTIASATIVAGDVISLDITAASSPVGLIVAVECSQP